MKRKVAALTAALILTVGLAACGGQDAAVGEYVCSSAVAEGKETDGNGAWLQLLANGTGVIFTDLKLNLTWQREGETLTVQISRRDQKETYTGRYVGDAIRLTVEGTAYTFQRTGSGEPESTAQSQGAARVQPGLYGCTGYSYGDAAYAPMGEWLELRADGSATLYVGRKERTGTWEQQGSELVFTGLDNVYGCEIMDGQTLRMILSGRLYDFQYGAQPEAPDWMTADTFETTTTSLQENMSFYGVVWYTNYTDVTSPDAATEFDLDIWGKLETDPETGKTRFSVAMDPEMQGRFLSYDVILEGDGFRADLEAGNGWLHQRQLTAADTQTFSVKLENGALCIRAHCKTDIEEYDILFFLREQGAPWDLENDPIPPFFDLYYARTA